MDLPPPLGGTGLQGEAIWTQIAGRQERAAGQRDLIFQGGLRSSLLSPAQRAGLRAALQILAAGWESPSAG